MKLSFFNGKKVLITGITGFKGSWLTLILKNLGAEVFGYSLDPPTSPSLYYLCRIREITDTIKGDIRDIERLKSFLGVVQPDIVFHLAAQPLVRESYENPFLTYTTNSMGTLNLLESIRVNKPKNKMSIVNITTDKVYRNLEIDKGYREEDVLDGYDPYSNSKSCSELITDTYRRSFFQDSEITISTCRAGNVIGGGDFAKDRIIPDCVRAALENKTIIVRNPLSIRPYQHVLEPLFAYLLVAEAQYGNAENSGQYNIGPLYEDCVTTQELVQLFCKYWPNQKWDIMTPNSKNVHEAGILRLDCSKIQDKLGWKPIWNIKEAVKRSVEWAKAYSNNANVNQIMEKQIGEYLIDKEGV